MRGQTHPLLLTASFWRKDARLLRWSGTWHCFGSPITSLSLCWALRHGLQLLHTGSAGLPYEHTVTYFFCQILGSSADLAYLPSLPPCSITMTCKIALKMCPKAVNWGKWPESWDACMYECMDRWKHVEKKKAKKKKLCMMQSSAFNIYACYFSAANDDCQWATLMKTWSGDLTSCPRSHQCRGILMTHRDGGSFSAALITTIQLLAARNASTAARHSVLEQRHTVADVIVVSWINVYRPTKPSSWRLSW